MLKKKIAVMCSDDDIPMKNENDKCVLCASRTEYTLTTPIDMRKYYIEGCGQLCKKCYCIIRGDR